MNEGTNKCVMNTKYPLLTNQKLRKNNSREIMEKVVGLLSKLLNGKESGTTTLSEQNLTINITVIAPIVTGGGATMEFNYVDKRKERT